MAKKTEHSDDDMIAAYESGEFQPIADQTAAKAEAQAAASAYLRKDARINIRLSHSDISMLKRRAAQEGLPYQTLIASVLHKFAAGRL